ncbi:MAG: FecR domain-containing protein, partial [Moraxellaceae bacterium]
MRKFSTVLSGKGLLAASVATLAAGPALAEVAGRASFVTGNVSVTGKDGSVRELRRGDAINTGDRISTNTGRLQIRFSDGGFVSLQPGTVFGIDEYLYANRKPEETSLFFNLIQGGMRTVTGAIGKVNKQSYKVRTPVATIGIRGTGYRAQIMRNGGLLVSVGSGFVNVANRMGDTTAGSGQNIAVPDENTAPGLTDEQVDIAATGTNGEQPGGGEGGQDDGNPSSGNLLAQEFGAVEDPSQLPGFTPVEPPAPTATTIASPYNYYPAAADAVFIGSQLISADDDGSPIFERGTLKTVNTGSWGNLRWGVFTDGAWSTNSLFGYEGSSLSATQFLPYIFTNETTNTLSLPYTDGSASYSLQGKSAAYSDNGKTGTLNNLALTVHFADMTLDALLSVTLDGRTYSGSGTNLSTYSYGPANSFST